MMETRMRPRRASRPVRGPARVTPDRAELTRLVRDHVHDWARVELHTGRTVCGWLCGAPAGAVAIYCDVRRPDQEVRVPVDEIARIELTGDTLRWVVPWQV